MKIRVYGKQDCSLCEAAKKNLRRLSLKFVFYDLEGGSKSWRKIDFVDAMAEYQLTAKLPIIAVDESFHTYTKAMKEIKRRLKHAKSKK